MLLSRIRYSLLTGDQEEQNKKALYQKKNFQIYEQKLEH